MKKNICFKLLVYIFCELFLLSGCKTTEKVFKSTEEQEPLPGGKKEWTAEVDQSMLSLINPPKKIPCFSQIVINRAEKKVGKELLPGRILTWSTDLGLASGFLEMYIEKGVAKILKPRMIYLLRMQVSYFVSSPYIIDINSWQYKDYQVTEEEILGLQGKKDITTISSFSNREITALSYAISMSRTPVNFDGQLLNDIRRLFSREEIVAIATLAAKVNYWARLVEAWRIKPTGYSDDPILEIDKFNTFSTTE